MRQTIFVVFLLMFISGHSQDNNSNDINICIACGYTGFTSSDVNNIQRLAASKSYVLLRWKLFSDNKAEAVLSAISLQELQATGRVSLLAQEQQRITVIGNWNDKYSVCYSSIGHFEGTISELMNNKRNPAYLIIRKTILHTT